MRAIAVGNYLAYFTGFSTLTVRFVAVVLIVLFTALHMIKMEAGAKWQSFITAVKIVPFLVLAISGLFLSLIHIFPSEYEAFKRYAELYPDNCTLLVDTYNVTRSGIPNAIRVFNEVLAPMGKRPKGVRIDSGDIAYLSKRARRMLDEAGYPDCGICASNSLDEYIVRDLLVQGALIDSFGIGENLITSKSTPVFGGVYKLAAVKAVSYTHLDVYKRQVYIRPGCRHRAVGQLKVINIPIPAFDPADEYFD